MSFTYNVISVKVHDSGFYSEDNARRRREISVVLYKIYTSITNNPSSHHHDYQHNNYSNNLSKPE